MPRARSRLSSSVRGLLVLKKFSGRATLVAWTLSILVIILAICIDALGEVFGGVSRGILNPSYGLLAGGFNFFLFFFTILFYPMEAIHRPFMDKLVEAGGKALLLIVAIVIGVTLVAALLASMSPAAISLARWIKNTIWPMMRQISEVLSAIWVLLLSLSLVFLVRAQANAMVLEVAIELAVESIKELIDWELKEKAK